MKILLLPIQILSSSRYVSPAVLVGSWLFLSSMAVVHALEFDTIATFADLANTCVFTHNRRSVICQNVNALGVAIKYTIPCPSSATQAQDCLVDRRRICYQQNNVPCLGSYYCLDTKRFSVDCSNIYSKATGSTCSATDCFGNCIALVDTVKPYTQQGRDNACTGLDSDYTVSCVPGTNIINNDNCEASFKWTNVLGDGTEVVLVVKKGPQEFAYRSCDVRTSAGDQCQCAIACSNSNFITYDCSRFSTDLCAAINCQGLCINNNNNRMTGQPQPTPSALSGVTARPPDPTTPPVFRAVVPPTRAPMAPPMTVPVPISNFWAVTPFAPVTPPSLRNTANPPPPVPVMAPVVLTLGNSPRPPVIPTPPVGFGPSPWTVRNPATSPVRPVPAVVPVRPFTPFPVNSGFDNNPSWIVRKPSNTIWSDTNPNPTVARPLPPTSAPPRAISNTAPTAPPRPFSSTSQPSTETTFDAAGAVDSQIVIDNNNINPAVVPAPLPVVVNNPVSVVTTLPSVAINPTLPAVEVVINPVPVVPAPTRPAEAPVPTRSGVVVSFTVQPAFRGPTTTFSPAVSRFADAIESAAWNPVLSLLTTMIAALSFVWS